MILAQWLAARRGRQAALAAHLSIKQPQVAAWVSGKRPVPLDHCPYIQDFTEGQVTCEEMRPDAAEYFARIRAQRPATSRSTAGDVVELALVDRRTSVVQIDFPDRRAASREAP